MVSQKKGLPKQVKAVRADEVCPQVCQVAPSQIAGAHRVVGQAVEGDLLHVEIPVKEEPAAVHHNKGKKDQKGKPQAQEKGLEEIVVPNALLFRFMCKSHKRAYLLEKRWGKRQKTRKGPLPAEAPRGEYTANDLVVLYHSSQGGEGLFWRFHGREER